MSSTVPRGGRLLHRTLTFDLPGAAFDPPGAPLDPRRWTELMAQVRAVRAEGPLSAAVRAGAWPVTGRQHDELAHQHRATMALALLLERELLELDRALTTAGIEYRVLKGPAIAHLDERDPSLRAFGDLDLLVPSAQVPDTVRLLEGRGGHRRFPEPRPGFDRRFSKGASFWFHDQLEVDLHRTLCPGPFGLALPLDRWWSLPAVRYELGDREVAALPRPARFVHACLHAILGQARPRPTALRDLALTAPRDATELAIAVALVGPEGALPVRDAVEAAASLLGWSPPVELARWSREVRGTSRAVRWRATYSGAHRSSARLALVGIEAVPGVRDKLAYAGAITLPRRSATRPLDRWRRGAAGLVPIRR